jgi:mlo protein
MFFNLFWSSWFGLFVYSQFDVTADPSKFRLTHQTSFVRQHASCWNKSTILLYVVSFHGVMISCRCTEY